MYITVMTNRNSYPQFLPAQAPAVNFFIIAAAINEPTILSKNEAVSNNNEHGVHVDVQSVHTVCIAYNIYDCATCFELSCQYYNMCMCIGGPYHEKKPTNMQVLFLSVSSHVVNPRRACAARVTVVGSVCVSVCLCVC